MAHAWNRYSTGHYRVTYSSHRGVLFYIYSLVLFFQSEAETFSSVQGCARTLEFVCTVETSERCCLVRNGEESGDGVRNLRSLWSGSFVVMRSFRISLGPRFSLEGIVLPLEFLQRLVHLAQLVCLHIGELFEISEVGGGLASEHDHRLETAHLCILDF